MADPLHQFVITRTIPIEVAGVDLSFTNSSAWMLIVTGLASLLIWAGLRKPTLVPGRRAVRGGDALRDGRRDHSQ